MWNCNGLNISMVRGDYGIELPITISGTTLTNADELMLVVKDRINGNTLLTKSFGNIQNNTVNLVLTAAESALLPEGMHLYSLDWYQSGHFLSNVIPAAMFGVVSKA